MHRIVHLHQVLDHNAGYILDTATAWMLVIFSHIIGDIVQYNPITNILPYIQLVSLLFASCASALTIYKILKDLKK
jgi:hypothetical protein